MKRLAPFSFLFLVAICMGTNSFAALAISSTSIDDAWEAPCVDAGGAGHDISRIGLTSSLHGWATASASVDSFNLAMTAYAAPHDMWLGDGTFATRGGIYTSGCVTTQFSANYSQLGITLTGYADWNYFADEQDMKVTLKDITATTTQSNVVHLDKFGAWWANTTQVFNIGVDPTHDYELTLSGWTVAWSAKMVDSYANIGNAEFGTPVPEPSTWIASALLLLPFGVQGFRHFRNRNA